MIYRKLETPKVVIIGPFVLHDDTVKSLNMERRYRCYSLRYATNNTCTSISALTSFDELYEFRYTFSNGI